MTFVYIETRVGVSNPPNSVSSITATRAGGGSSILPWETFCLINWEILISWMSKD